MPKTIRKASQEYPNAGSESTQVEQLAALLAQQQNSKSGNRKKLQQPQQKSWAQKKADKAKAAAKAKAKNQSKAAWDSTRNDLSAALHRNRAQLAPWLLAAPYAGVGELALLASQQPEVNPLGAAGAAAVAAGIGSAVAWKRKLRDRTPGKFTRRARAGVTAACAWCTSMPLLAPEVGQPSMWAAAVVGTVALSARWWQHNRPGYPDKPEKTDRGENHALGTSEVQNILDSWDNRVSVTNGPVPGAQLIHSRDLPTGSEFKVVLDTQGRVTQDNLDSQRGRIGLALGVMAGQLAFEGDDKDPAVVWLRIVDTAPDGKYTGPTILCNGKPIESRSQIKPGDDVDIAIGPYQDGEGWQVFRVITAGSVQGGFLLGSKGSGKSVLLEQIAIGLRWLGIEIWYFDGQQGASSDTLANEADWPITDTINGPAMLHKAVQRVAAVRQKELAGNPALNNRYDYDPARPPIMVLVDECHVLFNTVNPDTGQTYGAEFGALDRVYRKLGIGLIGASQDLDLPTFGHADVLRQGLYAGTALVLRFTSPAHSQLLPGNATGNQLAAVPEGGGFGYAPLGHRPNALWRAQEVKKPREWMASLPPATLDDLATKAAGRDYANRFDQKEVNQEKARTTLAALQAMSAEQLEAMLSGTGYGSVSTSTQNTGSRGSSGNGADSGNVIRMPGASNTATTGAREDGLTDRQADMLDLLAAHDLSTSQLADHYGVSEQAIRQDIRRLGEGRLTKVERGVYRTKKPAHQ